MIRFDRASLARLATELTVYGLLSVAFSWPLITRPTDAIVARHFDIFSMLWLLDVAPDLGVQLVTPLGGHPFVEDLRSVDSYVLLAIGFVLCRFLTPITVASLVTLLGPVVSALAAGRFAGTVLGARHPWTLLAGVIYGFSGLAATALLEGHVYVLLNPWLPLLGISLWRATRPEGRVRDGLLAGLTWGLSLYTTAYVGMAAALLVLWLLADGALRFGRRLPLRPILASALVAFPLALYYVALFRGDTVESLSYSSFKPSPVAEIFTGSAHLVGLAGVTPLTDAQNHSMAPVLGFTALALCLVAPVVLRRDTPRGWGTWALLGLFVILLSLGPIIGIKPDRGRYIPGLLWPILYLESNYFRFPVRLLWTGYLCLGGLAALVATRLAERRGRLAWPLFLFLAVDVLGGQRTWARTTLTPMLVPSAYASLAPDGAILEALPAVHGGARELDLYVGNLTCTYQRLHRRPFSNVCLNTKVWESPRHVLSGWLFRRVLLRVARERDQEVSGTPDVDRNVIVDTLGDLGIRSIVLHPDLLPRDERAQILDGMRDLLGEASADGHDGGEWVQVFTVPPRRTPAARSAEQAFAAVLKELK
jgi:hypothetical protein